MTRINFDLSKERVDELTALAEKTGATTRVQLFNQALTLLEWFVQEREAGRAVGSVDKDTERFSEILLPGMPPIDNEGDEFRRLMNRLKAQARLVRPGPRLHVASGTDPQRKKIGRFMFTPFELLSQDQGLGGVNLSSKETEVCILVGQGLTNKEIAGELGISPSTVSRQIAGILAKYQMEKRRELADLWRFDEKSKQGSRAKST